MKDLHAALAQVEESLSRLRAERARAVKLRDSAKTAYGDSDAGEDSPLFGAAREAVQAVAGIDSQIASEQERQAGLLKQMGDQEQGRAGFTLGGESGWAVAARRLDL